VLPFFGDLFLLAICFFLAMPQTTMDNMDDFKRLIWACIMLPDMTNMSEVESLILDQIPKNEGLVEPSAAPTEADPHAAVEYTAVEYTAVEYAAVEYAAVAHAAVEYDAGPEYSADDAVPPDADDAVPPDADDAVPPDADDAASDEAVPHDTANDTASDEAVPHDTANDTASDEAASDEADDAPRKAVKKKRKRKITHKKQHKVYPDVSPFDVERRDPPIRIMKRLRPHGHCDYIEEGLPRTAKDRARYAEALKDWSYRRHYGYLKAIPLLFEVI
jgi:hypothetical protein